MLYFFVSILLAGIVGGLFIRLAPLHSAQLNGIISRSATFGFLLVAVCAGLTEAFLGEVDRYSWDVVVHLALLYFIFSMGMGVMGAPSSVVIGGVVLPIFGIIVYSLVRGVAGMFRWLGLNIYRQFQKR
ncbi:MAG: hypothetical protein ABEI53_02910 [Candidatus Magasanikbacteria bacterium]